MPLSIFDYFITIFCIGGLVWIVIRLAATVVPLQIKEARVYNGLAKLRHQLLISGMTVLLASLIAGTILVISLLGVRSRLINEILITTFVICLIVNAETKYRIYHQQYTPQHKELSRRIEHEMKEEQEGGL